jgi:hypothetical protein
MYQLGFHEREVLRQNNGVYYNLTDKDKKELNEQQIKRFESLNGFFKEYIKENFYYCYDTLLEQSKILKKVNKEKSDDLHEKGFLYLRRFICEDYNTEKYNSSYESFLDFEEEEKNDAEERGEEYEERSFDYDNEELDDDRVINELKRHFDGDSGFGNLLTKKGNFFNPGITEKEFFKRKNFKTWDSIKTSKMFYKRYYKLGDFNRAENFFDLHNNFIKVCEKMKQIGHKKYRKGQLRLDYEIYGLYYED